MTRQQPAKARCSVQPTANAVRKDMFAPRPRKKSFLLLEEFFSFMSSNTRRKPEKLLTGEDFGKRLNEEFRKRGLPEVKPAKFDPNSNEVSVIFLRKNPNN